MELFGVTEKQYGWIFALIAGGLIVSSQMNSLLLRKFKSEQIIRIALFCQSITGLTLILGSIYGWFGLYGTIGLIFVFLSCQGFTFPNSSALSLAPFSKNAGSASALMGGIQMAIGASTSAVVSMLANETAIPMAAVMAACSMIAFTTLMVGRKIIFMRASAIKVQEESAEMLITS